MKRASADAARAAARDRQKTRLQYEDDVCAHSTLPGRAARFKRWEEMHKELALLMLAAFDNLDALVKFGPPP